MRELQHELAPAAVRAWAAKPADWLQIHAAEANAADLIDLDLGEAEAIALARQLSADLLLMDDQAGRRAALQAGLRVTGTLAVLDDASSQGMLDLPDALPRLSNTSFRVSRTLLDSLKLRRR
jgi:predicted nucleic acid-binding protein